MALMTEMFNYAQSRSIEIKVKAAQGATALGTLFAAMGKQIEQFAMQLFTYFPQIKVMSQTRLGHNIIDFMLRYGSKIVDLEVKYSLPRHVGPQCTRLINQINSMLAHTAASERIVWTFTKPTTQQIQFWMTQLGDNYNKITWIYGPEGLHAWVQKFLGL